MEIFSLKNQLEKVYRGENTSFLNPIDTRYIINKLKKNSQQYQVFKLFPTAEKLIVYKDKLDISLYLIETNSILTHREILGSLFSHNLNEELYGDIIIDNNMYYICILNKIKKYMLINFNNIGTKKIKLHEVPLEIVNNYELKYKKINIITSSLRIDNIVSKIIPTSRSIATDIIKDNKIIVNYQILKNKNYILKENDIFSIRGIGKFKFLDINTINKSGKYNITIVKYI